MSVITNSAIAWLVIFVSGLLEIVFSVSMKLSDGYSKFWPSAVSVVAANLSVWLKSHLRRHSGEYRLCRMGRHWRRWHGCGGDADVPGARYRGSCGLYRFGCHWHCGLAVAVVDLISVDRSPGLPGLLAGRGGQSQPSF